MNAPRIISWMPGRCATCGAEVVNPVTMQWGDNMRVHSVVGPGYPPDTPTDRHVCPIPPGEDHQ